VVGAGDRQDGGFKNEESVWMHLAKLWAIQVSNLAEIKGNLLHGGLFIITGLYSHSQPPTGWPRQHLHP